MLYGVRVYDKKGNNFVSQIDGNFYVRENFQLKELANTKAKETVRFIYDPMVSEFLDEIQEFRTWFNKPMQVNSCFRTETFNKSCGGSSNSLHKDARALDWGIVGHTEQQRMNVMKKWKEICEKHGKIGGINFYSWGYHLDDHEDKFGSRAFIVRDYRK